MRVLLASARSADCAVKVYADPTCPDSRSQHVVLKVWGLPWLLRDLSHSNRPQELIAKYGKQLAVRLTLAPLPVLRNGFWATLCVEAASLLRWCPCLC
jgi:hypothetical protein